MRLFTWEGFSVNKSCFSLILSAIVFVFYIETAYTSDRVANITVEGGFNKFKIRDTDKSDKEIGTFEINIKNETIHLIDKGLVFDAKITPTIDEVIKYKNKEEIEKNEEGEIILTECIEYADLHNRKFDKILQFSSEKQNLHFDEVRLSIDPIIQLKLESSNVVDFGKIRWNKGYITASNSPIVCFSYSILKNATCKVESKNNFNLKHERKDEFIEYSLKIQDSARQYLYIEDNKFQLSAQQKEFSVQFDISTFTRHIPSFGNWEDSITFSIVCEK